MPEERSVIVEGKKTRQFDVAFVSVNIVRRNRRDVTVEAEEEEFV